MKRALAVALALAGGTAAAQQQPAPPPAEPPVVTPVVPDEEGPIPEPQIPEDPMAQVPKEPEVETPAVRYAKSDYPIELVRRPLTLAAEQVEVGIDVPFFANDGNPALTQVLRGAFGATVDLQVGLTYAIGLERLDAAAGEDGFVAGKAFSVDAAYTLIPGWLAAQARVAFFIDPDLLAVGLILGLPFKIALQDRWAIVGGADLVRLKLKGFAVDPADAGANAAMLAEIDRGVEASEGGASFVAGVQYQARQNLAVYGTFGVGWPDFDTSDQPFSLFFGTTVSPKRWLDLGARAGFASLDDPGASFQLAVYAAARM
jgi:hypothetical protein